MPKDWKGNRAPVFVTNGATGHASHKRAELDYYATEPRATKLLLQIEKFSASVWEPACGEGHIAEELKNYGHEVTATDIVNRGYKGQHKILDFLSPLDNNRVNLDIDIITNPPYKFALDFVKKSLSVISDGHKVAMFLKLTFLEGKERKAFFENNPPKVVWVSSSRLQCGMNGKFEGTSATAYAWFIWEKGFKGDTIIKWFN